VRSPYSTTLDLKLSFIAVVIFRFRGTYSAILRTQNISGSEVFIFTIEVHFDPSLCLKDITKFKLGEQEP